MTFKCLHCGQCCTDDCTQINLSLGDINRLCEFLKCDVSALGDKIAMRPFEDPENPGSFDVEIGLKLPCGFRQAGRCVAYAARPLNCRMFPSVFLGNVPDEALGECIDPTHKCVVSGISMNAEEKERYKNYSKYIGELILAEAEETERFYEEQGRKTIILRDCDSSMTREGTLKRYKEARGKIDDALDLEKLQEAVAAGDFASLDALNERENGFLEK
ncbi:YkgJ family cysteine cluster protein [Candidatus Woesearchaeota archaeon]|nr:YkgJ family cysteine cluster protein [Candidatus Woesearchaeota archaeon]